jgi:hypothetical protein
MKAIFKIIKRNINKMCWEDGRQGEHSATVAFIYSFYFSEDT